MTPPLYLFGTPGKVGGAATKIRHLILLLKDSFRVTVVLNHVSWLKNKEVAQFLAKQGVPCCLLKDLPPRCDGLALAVCEADFFASGGAREVKRRGLRLIWSNEMMFEFKGERQAVQEGLVDKVLFVSEFQQHAFAEIYRGVPCATPGNYIAPEDFPFEERRNEIFTLGRLSRPDMDKYPENFPVFYESLGLSDVRYRVKAWDDALRRKYKWHHFGPQWEFLGPQQEATDKFLHSLDLFVYPLGHLIKESWGRSTVEAMLTGCIPLVPAGHQFHNLIAHGENGFICRSFAEYRDAVLQLHRDARWRREMAAQAAQHARMKLCCTGEHRAVWMEALLN